MHSLIHALTHSVCIHSHYTSLAHLLIVDACAGRTIAAAWAVGSRHHRGKALANQFLSSFLLYYFSFLFSYDKVESTVVFNGCGVFGVCEVDDFVVDALEMSVLAVCSSRNE